MAIDYQTQLNKIKEAQKQSAIADLENTRNQALSDLQAEREQNAANFNTQRNQANIQNQLAAKNFKEYLVNSGRSNSGIMPQYEMNRQNNLQRSINDINASQNMALADINRRNTLANQAYNTGLQSANARIEADYITNLLAQQQAEWQRQMQEKEYNEKIRQFNENMAWEKQKYADQLSRQSLGRSSGRSSRGRSYGGSSGGSSGQLSSAGQALLGSMTNTQNKAAAVGAGAAGIAANLNALNSAYKSGKVTAKDVKNIAKKMGL